MGEPSLSDEIMSHIISFPSVETIGPYKSCIYNKFVLHNKVIGKKKNPSIDSAKMGGKRGKKVC